MARSKKVESITPTYKVYPCESSCGRVDRPLEVDDYEKYAEHFLLDAEDDLEMDVTSFVKEIAC